MLTVGQEWSGYAAALGEAADNVELATAALLPVCLLYTSDAADERSSVDLGGRRIIKKKKHYKDRLEQSYQSSLK